MDSLENYLLAVMKENKVTLEPNDPLCVLHTILSKFEDDLLESQRKCLEAFKSDIEASCSSIEATEKLRGGKKQRLYGTHLYLPGEGGLLVGLWANIDKLDEHQQRLKEDSIRELQNEFGKQRIGPSGFLFVTDSKGTPR